MVLRMWMLSYESVYIGYSLTELEKVKDLLVRAGIKYKQKTVNHSAQWGLIGSKRRMFSSVGINQEYEKQYTVWVKNPDYAVAKRLIDTEVR